MGKVKYKIKHIGKDVPSAKRVKMEAAIADLAPLIPTLAKHSIKSDVAQQVKTLRSGRKSRTFTLELTREFPWLETKETLQDDGSIKTEYVPHKTLVAAAPVDGDQSVTSVLRTLKENIMKQVKDRRAERLPKKESYEFNHGVVVPKMDMVYLEPESVLKAMFKKIRLDMKNDKHPDKETKIRYIGVEIELAAVENREQLCDAIFAAGIGKHICVKNDGSIGDGSRDQTVAVSKLREKFPHTHEICVLAKENEIEEVIKKLCHVLNNVLHVSVDKTCGLHVHFDMRSRDVKLCFNNLVLSQQFLYAMLPAQRRNSRYSRPTKGADYRDGTGDRFCGVNSEAYRKYQTLELRMHCGTTNERKINNWIKLGIAICNAPKMKSAPTTIAAFKKATNLDDKIVSYVESRIAKFAEQHKKSVPSAEEPGTMVNIEPVTATPDAEVLEPSEVA